VKGYISELIKSLEVALRV